MNLRPLLIDDHLRHQIQQVLAYAANHHYQPNITTIPGDLPQHVLLTDHGYRIVFSFTQMPDDSLYRDISISVATKGRFPNPFAAFTIAQLFGFSDWDHITIDPPPPTWLIAKDLHHDAIRLAQLITDQNPVTP